TQFLSQGFASRGIRLKYSKVEAIGNDFHFVFVVAEFGVRHTRGFRTANDALGQPGRKDFADPRGPDGEPLVLPGIQIRMMNSPDDRLSSKTRSKSAQEIGVVHPRLYQIRLRFLDPPGQAQNMERIRRTALHAKRSNADACSLQASGHGAGLD